MFDYLLFDLDGTMIDSSEGVTKCTQYALKHLGIEETDLKKLLCFIGPTPEDAFKEFYNLDGEENALACTKFRECYKESGIKQYKLFPGIPQLLALLKSKGIKLAVATTKNEASARIILDESGITQYFDIISGAVRGVRDDKIAVVRYALDSLGAPADKSKTALVGDRKYDVEGAHRWNIACVGVGFGFAPPGELENSADYYVPDMDGLKNLLLGD